jgi:DNA-binding response OmpR family regulator
MKNILILDDSTLLCEAISAGIYNYIKNGIFVFIANTYEHANKIIKENVIDIVLADIDLNNKKTKDGLKFLVNIKLFNDDIPIIIMSGGVNDKAHILDMGATAYYQKPFNLKDLINYIKLLLNFKGAGPRIPYRFFRF